MSEAYYPEGPWDVPEIPWKDDPDNPENHSMYCTCEDCLQNHPENYIYLDDDEIECDGCDGGGCPLCLPCAGIYAAGTEECEWCPHEQECVSHAVRA